MSYDRTIHALRASAFTVLYIIVFPIDNLALIMCQTLNSGSPGSDIRYPKMSRSGAGTALRHARCCWGFLFESLTSFNANSYFTSHIKQSLSHSRPDSYLQWEHQTILKLFKTGFYRPSCILAPAIPWTHCIPLSKSERF